MLAQWAESQGLAYRDELVSTSKAYSPEQFQRLAERYIAERLAWAQREVIRLRVAGLVLGQQQRPEGGQEQ
jgi:hypothetical protein